MKILKNFKMYLSNIWKYLLSTDPQAMEIFIFKETSSILMQHIVPSIVCQWQSWVFTKMQLLLYDFLICIFRQQYVIISSKFRVLNSDDIQHFTEKNITKTCKSLPEFKNISFLIHIMIITKTIQKSLNSVEFKNLKLTSTFFGLTQCLNDILQINNKYLTQPFIILKREMNCSNLPLISIENY